MHRHPIDVIFKVDCSNGTGTGHAADAPLGSSCWGDRWISCTWPVVYYLQLLCTVSTYILRMELSLQAVVVPQCTMYSRYYGI